MHYLLNLKDFVSVETAINSIADSITEISLHGRFDITPIEVWVQLVSRIPSSVTALKLEVLRFNADQLTAILKVIPSSVTSLNLSGQGLGAYRTGHEIENILSAIPLSITTLNLSNNNLCFTNEVLTQTFKFIPSSVRELDLSHNQLNGTRGPHSIKVTHAQLVQNFRDIPRFITTLNLSGNHLGAAMPVQILVEAFRAIPLSVTALDLSDNELWFIVDGSDSDLLHLAKPELIALVLQAIPTSIIKLNLSRNQLNYMTSSQLADVFKALPISVTILDLSENDLDRTRMLEQISASEIAHSFSSLPAGVMVSLRRNSLFLYRRHLERDSLLEELKRGNRISCNLDLSFNGEADFQRALAPMICFSRKPISTSSESLPLALVEQILSFLVPTKKISSTEIQCKIQQEIGRLFSIIKDRPSVNNTLSVGIPLQR